MSAADLAPLPVAPLVLVVLGDLVLPLGHFDRLELPEGERVDRPGGPAPTGSAMAVAGALGIARDDNRHGAAVALPFKGLVIVAHESPFGRGIVATSPAEYPAGSGVGVSVCSDSPTASRA